MLRSLSCLQKLEHASKTSRLKMEGLKKLLALLWWLWLMLGSEAAAAAHDDEAWVRVDHNSSSFKLLYRSTPEDDQIMDFSSVGYRLGMQPIPYPPVRVTLFPGGGDDSEMLQNAINQVSSMPQDEQGLRGTIKLSKGTFILGSQSIVINSSGIVIDGSGPETIIDAHSMDNYTVLFRILGQAPEEATGNFSSKIIDTVPSGTKTLKLDTLEGLSPGDQVVITWSWSSAWIRMMKMSKYWKPGYRYKALSFRIDIRYMDETNGASVQKISTASRISEVGLQNFKAVKANTNPGTGCFLKMENVEDSWLTGLELHEFSGTIPTRPSEFLHTTLAIGGKRITLQELVLFRSSVPGRGAKPFDIALHRPGQQILVRNVVVQGSNEYSFMSGDSISGPNVFYNCTGIGSNRAQPHMKFATGLLYDNVRIPEGSIEMINRKGAGSGHGIAAGYSVAWNTETRLLEVMNPPGGANWAVGFRAQAVNIRVGSDGSASGYLMPCSDVVKEIPSLFLAQRRAAEMPVCF